MLYYDQIIIFLWIPASATDAAVVNPNESKTFLINGLAEVFKNGKAILVKGLRSSEQKLYEDLQLVY